MILISRTQSCPTQADCHKQKHAPPTQFPRVVWLAALCTLRAVSSAGRTDRCRLALSIAESGPPLRLVQEVLLRATGPQTWCGCDVDVSTMYDVGRLVGREDTYRSSCMSLCEVLFMVRSAYVGTSTLDVPFPGRFAYGIGVRTHSAGSTQHSAGSPQRSAQGYEGRLRRPRIKERR